MFWGNSSGTNYILIIVLAVVLGLLWNIEIGAPEISPPAPSEVEGIGGDEEGVSTTTIIAVGDILLSRHVGTQIDKANNPNLPFDKLGDLTSGADITFGNLECPLASSSIPIREGLVFRCLTKYVPGLLFAGFDVLSTANNHAMDQGIDDLEFTIDYFLSQGILPVGTKKLLSNSMELDTWIGKNEIQFGFLAYSYSAFNDGKASTHPQIETMNIEKLRQDILEMKGHTADVVIVSMHAGTEYTRKPTQAQIDFARAAIDAGADVVIGHHPHWIQTIEVYNGRPIFYSLGNFVFDQEWSRETKEGLMVELSFEKQELKSVKLMPVIIENFCCPRLADEEEKKTIFKKINLESNTINF